MIPGYSSECGCEPISLVSGVAVLRDRASGYKHPSAVPYCPVAAVSDGWR